MNTLYFTVAKAQHEAAVLQYAAEHARNGEHVLHGSSQLEQYESYAAWLHSLSLLADPEQAAKKNWVQSTTLLCLRKEDDRLVGMITIRHTLNDFLRQYGGHIGIGVRPSERGKGCGSEMLRHALRFCAGLGIKQALIGCSKDNAASRNTILRCGGRLIKEYLHTDGDTVQLYTADCGESPIGLLRGTVQLLPHDPVWESLGQSAALTCSSILADACIDAQHVGSTAVAGLAAKPILDIAVGVADLAAAAQKLPQLEAAGFIHVPSVQLPQELFCSAGSLEENIRTHHIHIVAHGSEQWRNYIAFRDALCQNSTLRNAYGQLKLQLAAQHAADRSAYTDAKADFIARCIAENT
ncbi:MAG: GNAT family N-acetyltransferase [Oscillospiraceae bacterium]|nr:GNAT family N-acetyltransferase [Oscillospiraceae bacterium]